ncbi:MAG: hypothetical protein O2779_00005 [Nanoarchaeota archaeon]|nr:hypothetical protein [Nanoarchaeota archaeon]
MASYAYNLENFFRILEEWGLSDVMLPFLLVFVVFFAILEKTNILGERARKYNLVIALVIALMVVVPHVTGLYPVNKDPVDIFNEAIPSISIVIVAAMGVLILIGTMGGKVSQNPMYASGGVILTGVVIYVLSVDFIVAPLILGLAVALLIVNFFSQETKLEGIVQGAIVVFSFVVVLFFFGRARGWFHALPDWLVNPIYHGAIIFTMIVFSLVVYAFSAEE